MQKAKAWRSLSPAGLTTITTEKRRIIKSLVWDYHIQPDSVLSGLGFMERWLGIGVDLIPSPPQFPEYDLLHSFAPIGRKLEDNRGVNRVTS